MIKHRLSEDADEDLKGIYIYSLENFGLRQARKYKTDLGKQFLALSDNPKIGISYNHIKTGLRRYVYRSHSIYYRIEDRFILVLRVLGNSLDPARHL